MTSKNTLTTDSWDVIYTYLQTTNPISTNNIFSSINSKLVTEVGYPIVILSPPMAGFQKLSANGVYTESEINIMVQVYHKSAASVKALKDEVVAKLLAGRKVLSGSGLKRMNMSGGDYDAWEEGKKKIHRLSFDLTFTYIED